MPVSDPIDKATFKLLFDKVASGQNSLWFGSIKKYGEDPFGAAGRRGEGLAKAC